MNLQILQYDKNFSKKLITQIDVIPEYQLLFSLTDGLVGIHDIARHNFSMVHSKASTKGASLFTLNVNRSTSLTGETELVVRLCVVIKKQLQLALQLTGFHGNCSQLCSVFNTIFFVILQTMSSN